MVQVFLVSGGTDQDDDLNFRSSTETLVEGNQAWNFQKPLPSARMALRGISLPDTVIMAGKNIQILSVELVEWDQVSSVLRNLTIFSGGGVLADGENLLFLDDVLMFDPKDSDWKKIGGMKTARGWHGASLVNMNDVINYCY